MMKCIRANVVNNNTRDNDPSPLTSPRIMRNDGAAIIAAKETRNINILRFITLLLLVTIVVLACIGVYQFTASYERLKFEDTYEQSAHRIIERFQLALERRLGGISSMADAITSHALSSNESFPRVTVPHFEVLGSSMRIQSEALIVRFMPLVTDETRLEWEEYAQEKRFHIDEAYEADKRLREEQDEAFGFVAGSIHPPVNNATTGPATSNSTATVLDDGTEFHPRIWQSGGLNPPESDEPEGSGPYLPLWQRSAVSEKRQSELNRNFANTRAFQGVLPILMESHRALMNSAIYPSPASKGLFEESLKVSQYRHDLQPYMDDPITFIAYPVFDSFDVENRNVAGVLATNVYWRLFFTDILPEQVTGVICIIENSYNQTLSYRLDGKDVTYLGEGDPHDERYDFLEQSADINEYVEARAGPGTRSYTTVQLNQQHGKYRLRVYPSKETEASFSTNKPWIYIGVVLAVFVLTALLLLILDRIISKRQKILMDQVIQSAKETAEFEHELNAFLAHEVRNPVAAALSAHGFVVSAINEMPSVVMEDNSEHKIIIESLREDVKIIGSSLYFVDDFLRSMLDVHASAANKIEMHRAPADILKDVLEPVCSMLHQRDGRVDVTVDCPENILVMTDSLRLKQVMINLGRNSIKFTPHGFVRYRVAVVNNLVELYVEDSGPGIPLDKRDVLFEKFQSSLDVLSQGTGVGLCLCENLVGLLNGTIYLDGSYDSGVVGSPGARFVVQLNTPCLGVESMLDSSTNVTSTNTISSTDPAAQSTRDGNLQALPENLSVLFVDDDPILRKLFARAVKKAGPSWTISEAASGEAAIQLVESSSKAFDVIWMDMYMSSTEKQMLGVDAVRELRSRGVDATICGLSANNMEEQFRDAGADSFLLKPFPCDPVAAEQELLRIVNLRNNCSV